MSYGAPHGPGHGGGGASSDPAAALRGASLAFSKKKPPVPPPPTTTAKNKNNSGGNSSNNGALTAATLSTQHSGASGLPDMDSAASRNIITARLQQLGASQQQQQQQSHGVGSNTHLQPPGRVDPKSASFIAATLAASRSGSPSPKNLTPKRKTSVGALSSITMGDAAVDSESIPPTGSLISIFEGGGGGDPVKKMPRRRRSTETLTPKKEKRAEKDITMSSPVTQVVNKQAVRPDQLGEATPPRLKHLVSQDTSDGRRAEVKKPSISPPRQSSSVPKITNKYSKTNMRPLTPPPQPSFESQPQQQIPQHSHRRTKSRPDAIVRPPSPPESRVSAPIVKPSRPSEEVPVVPQKQVSQGPSHTVKTPSAVPHLEPLSHRGETRSERPVKTGTKPQAPPAPPKPRSQVSAPNLRQDAEYEIQNKAAAAKPKLDRGPAPLPPKPRGSSKRAEATSSSPTVLHRVKTTDTVSSNDVFVSAPTSPVILASPHPLPKTHRTTRSGPSSPTRPMRRGRSGTATSTNSQALDSLTSAIVAGSLAASRLTPSSTGTSLPPPSSTPMRQKSPRLRQTLRGPVDSSDSEDDRYKKTHHHRPKLRSGKHAHHEGARKRWRDEVRPRERKRYEAVWASNRGLHLPHASSPAASSVSSGGKEIISDYANSVANVVVREIWKRSRLPEDELIEVWELVDRNRRGFLSRQEFVVGMWLIDQRLKGRKIPTKVSESVWGSANGNGLMVMRPK